MPSALREFMPAPTYGSSRKETLIATGEEARRVCARRRLDNIVAAKSRCL